MGLTPYWPYRSMPVGRFTFENSSPTLATSSGYGMAFLNQKEV